MGASLFFNLRSLKLEKTMSTEMSAKTLLVDPSIAEDIKNPFDAEPVFLRPAPGLVCYAGDDGRVINQARGSSRRDWFSYAAGMLCKRAGISGLEFFHGSLETPCRWRWPIGGDEDDEDVYGYAYGYWLEGDALQAAHTQLTRLLQWAASNLDRISGDDFLGYYGDADEIAAAIEDGRKMDSDDMQDAMYAEDGDGPGYLFAYLGTCEHLFANAIASSKAVLHVAEIPN